MYKRQAKIEVGAGLTEYEAQIDKSRGKLSIASAQQQLGYQPKYCLLYTSRCV